MAPTRERTRHSMGAIRRSLNRSITNLFNPGSQATPSQNSAGISSFNTYGPSTSSINPFMNLGSQETQVLFPFAISNGNPIDVGTRPRHPAKEDTWSRTLSSRILRRKNYANANAKRVPVRPLFGLDDEKPETADVPGALVTDSIPKENPQAGRSATMGNITDAIEPEDDARSNTMAETLPFQDFLSTMPTHQQTAIAITPSTEHDANTQTPENQTNVDISSSSTSSVEAVEPDSENTEISVATCVHFTQISRPAIQRINTRASTSSSRCNLIIYPPNQQSHPTTLKTTSQRLSQRPESFGPVSPFLPQTESSVLHSLEPVTPPNRTDKTIAQEPTSIGQLSQLFLHGPRAFPEHCASTVPTQQPENMDPNLNLVPPSPANSWITGRTTLDFHVLSQDELAQRRNFERTREIWERGNAEDMEQRLSGDTLVNGRTQHEILDRENESLGIGSSLPVVSPDVIVGTSSATLQTPTIVVIPTVIEDGSSPSSTTVTGRGSTNMHPLRPYEQQQILEEDIDEYDRDIEHWARTTQNGERLRPGPGWIRRTNSYPRVNLRRAFN